MIIQCTDVFDFWGVPDFKVVGYTLIYTFQYLELKLIKIVCDIVSTITRWWFCLYHIWLSRLKAFGPFPSCPELMQWGTNRGIHYLLSPHQVTGAPTLCHQYGTCTGLSVISHMHRTDFKFIDQFESSTNNFWKESVFVYFTWFFFQKLIGSLVYMLNYLRKKCGA